MTRPNLSALLLLVTIFLLDASGAARAAESYDNCSGVITSLPAVISTQGTWCLKQDLATAISSGYAITISTNNVTIDCNDFKLGGLAAGAGTQAYGIFAQGRLNATVRHCNIRGFKLGVSLQGGSGGGHAIEDSLFDGNTVAGIDVEGDGSVIRRNRVFNSGGSTSNSDAEGISTHASVDIVDNTISGVVATSGSNGYAYGIITFNNSNGQIAGNGVRGLAKAGTGEIYGILNLSSDRISVHDNDVATNAGPPSSGLYCNSSNGSARDNMISGFATAMLNCTNNGGNDFVP